VRHQPARRRGGLFGRGEEGTKVLPGVEAARARGLDVQGPLPADALFYRAGRGDFDLVVAMYHDQGHGPVKVLGVESGVNITVGLPFVRTSVDHGTAFDIAGTGRRTNAAWSRRYGKRSRSPRPARGESSGSGNEYKDTSGAAGSSLVIPAKENPSLWSTRMDAALPGETKATIRFRRGSSLHDRRIPAAASYAYPREQNSGRNA